MEDEQAFRDRISTLGNSMSSNAASMGGALLQCMGQCYVQGARRALSSSTVSGGIGQPLVGAQTACSDWYWTVQNAMSIFSDILSLMSVRSMAEEGQADAHTLTFQENVSTAHLKFDTTKLEIRSLLKAVCFKVTHDQGVEQDVRQRRAEAIGIVGEIFCSVGSSLDTYLETQMPHPDDPPLDTYRAWMETPRNEQISPETAE